MPGPPVRTVGIVANEFFDARIGRMGGFGWAALAAAHSLAEAHGREIRPVFISGEHHARRLRAWGTLHAHDISLVPRSRGRSWARRLRSLGLDLLLAVDHRPGYLPVLEALPDVPLIVWVRDPRTPSDQKWIATLEIPGEDARPQGIRAIDTRSLHRVLERSRAEGRPIAFASPAPAWLQPKAVEAYGVPALPLEPLANPLPFVEPVPSAARPLVAFVGRLDPIKRPWLAAELARRLPHAEFVMLGQAHFSGPGSGRRWLDTVPSNLRVLGHLDGAEKTRVLSSAWVLLNTSIHEALPVSFLEAFHCGVPVVACHDPDGLVTRFGAYVGRVDGSGADGLPAFEEGLRAILEDEALRSRLGAESRDWARANHTRRRFLEHFAALTAWSTLAC